MTPKPAHQPPPPPRIAGWAWCWLMIKSVLVDHAIFRFWFNLRHRVGPVLFRSSHPMPYQLRAAQRAGIKSVINLRGHNDQISSNLISRVVCQDLGLPLAHFPLLSRQAPRPEEVLGFAELLRTLPKPILLHCKSGADRAGLGSALYLLMHEGRPVEEAQRELCLWPHGHVRQAKTGILDAFLDEYRAFNAATPTPFTTWLTQHYSPDALNAEYAKRGAFSWLIDDLLKRE